MRAEGFEAEISGELIDNLEAVAGYAYTETEQHAPAGASAGLGPIPPSITSRH